ncbi:MAG TPA: class I adenylate-forming enzyme family protein [Mycobacterium sp.]
MTAERSTIPEVLTRRRHRGEHPLLICDGERISYAEADQRSARLARGLIALGAGKGTHVGLLYPNGVDFVVAMLAATRIGAVVVPFSTFSTPPELRWQLAHSAVGILLSCNHYRAHDYPLLLAAALGIASFESPVLATAAPQLRHIVFDIGQLAEACNPALTEVESDVDSDDTLAIIYTSGSTGTPKGAVHTHRGLLDHQRSLNDIRGLTAQDTLFSNSPFFWIGGFAFGLLATLTAGCTLVCSNAVEAAATLDLLEAEKPTMTNGFVASVNHLTRDPSFAGRDLSSMRRGNLYPIMAPDVRPADPELRHNILGMTEAGSVLLISGDDNDQPEHRRGSYGRPAPGFEAMIIDTDRSGVGELCIRGPYVMQRYHGRSREDCFDADGWFHTGDLVRTDSDGLFYFLGRAGSMIKTAGANVSPAEVERALTRITGCTAFVVGLADSERGQIVAAAVATEDPAGFDEPGVVAALRADLSAYKIPRRFVPVLPHEVPLLSSGKVDLPELARLFDA